MSYDILGFGFSHSGLALRILKIAFCHFRDCQMAFWVLVFAFWTSFFAFWFGFSHSSLWNGIVSFWECQEMPFFSLILDFSIFNIFLKFQIWNILLKKDIESRKAKNEISKFKIFFLKFLIWKKKKKKQLKIENPKI